VASYLCHVAMLHYVMMEHKLCPKCQQTKPYSDFPTERRKGKADRPACYCRECWNAYTRARAQRPEIQAKAKAAYRAKCIRLGKGRLSKPYASKTPEQKAKAYEAVKRWRNDHPLQSAVEARQSLQMRRSYAYQAAWPLIVQHYGDKCLCCGFPRKLVFDHVQPMAKGGANLLTNGQPLCVGCNTGKGQMGDGCKDYRPDQGQWIGRLVEANPWLGEAFPVGRWSITSDGRERAERIRGLSKAPLAIPE
jgi:hypothetical protein